MLLDEPFGALDDFTRESLNLELAGVVSRQGSVVLVVTHSIGEAIFLGIRIVTLGGRPGVVRGIVTDGATAAAIGYALARVPGIVEQVCAPSSGSIEVKIHHDAHRRTPPRRIARSAAAGMSPAGKEGCSSGGSPRPARASALIAIFEFVFQIELVSPLVWPSPFEVIDEIAEQAVSSTDVRPEHVGDQQEALWGFGFIGSVGGVALGAGIAALLWMSRAFYPYVILLQSMPRIALVPVFVAMLGFGMGAKIVTAVVLRLLPPLISTIVGLREVDQEAMTLMRSLCATKRRIFRKLLWPSALPSIFGGLENRSHPCVPGAFVGEITAANEGVGLLIDTAAAQLNMPLLFAYVFWFSVISLVLYGVLELIDNKVVFWKGAQRHEILRSRSVSAAGPMMAMSEELSVNCSPLDWQCARLRLRRAATATSRRRVATRPRRRASHSTSRCPEAASRSTGGTRRTRSATSRMRG